MRWFCGCRVSPQAWSLFRQQALGSRFGCRLRGHVEPSAFNRLGRRSQSQARSRSLCGCGFAAAWSVGFAIRLCRRFGGGSRSGSPGLSSILRKFRRRFDQGRASRLVSPRALPSTTAGFAVGLVAALLLSRRLGRRFRSRFKSGLNGRLSSRFSPYISRRRSRFGRGFGFRLR